MKRASLLLILIALLLFQPNAVQAQSAPSCSYQPDGSIFCTTGGGNDDGGDDGGDGGWFRFNSCILVVESLSLSC